MGSFLDMEQRQRRMYVARSLGLDPDSPDSWPVETIDGIISKAEYAADHAVLEECRRLMSRRS